MARKKKPRAIIHVNRSHIAKNAKDGGNRPVYTVKMDGKVRYAREVVIKGEVRFVYDGRQLGCGARAWAEVDIGLVELVDEMDWSDAREAV